MKRMIAPDAVGIAPEQIDAPLAAGLESEPPAAIGRVQFSRTAAWSPQTSTSSTLGVVAEPPIVPLQELRQPVADCGLTSVAGHPGTTEINVGGEHLADPVGVARR